MKCKTTAASTVELSNCYNYFYNKDTNNIPHLEEIEAYDDGNSSKEDCICM